MRITRTGVAALGTVGVLAAGLAIPAIAQDDTTGGETTTESVPSGPFAERVEDRKAALAERLADELGLETDVVADALDAVHEDLREERQTRMRAALEERLADAVAEGDLTQEQADAILAAHDAGVFPARRGPRFGGHGHGPRLGPGAVAPEADDAA